MNDIQQNATAAISVGELFVRQYIERRAPRKDDPFFRGRLDEFLRSSKLPLPASHRGNNMKTQIAALTIGIILASTCGFVQADTLLKGNMQGQPQITVKNGKTTACGLRIVGGNDINRPDDVLNGFDVSFNIYDSYLALYKGLASRPISGKDLVERKKIDGNVPLKSFWIKAPKLDASSPIGGKVIPGETKHSLLYGSDLNQTLKLLNAVLDRQEIKVGIHRAGDTVGNVFYGVVQLTDEDIEQTGKCLGELLETMNQSK